jgi:parallel beta-helix repeat protein
VRVANFSIRADGYNGAIVSGGYAVFERCDIGPTAFSCVLVRDGAEAAVLICDLHHAQHCGLHTEHGSKSLVVGSILRENGKGGVFFSTNAEGVVEGNLIERNSENGVYIAGGANPCIRRNRIRHNPYGIIVYLYWPEYGPGRGIIEDNEISDSERFGIQIEQGGNPCVRRNTIKLNGWGGIVTLTAGNGTIYDNRILDNVGSGIKNDGGCPRIGKNSFSGNGGQPIEDDLGTAILDDTFVCPE